MADPIKRLHYFDHQFLRADDFTDEQEYHTGMRRRHNRLLHTWGIADGLEVEFETGASGVTIRPGTAIDSDGREIVLTEDRFEELSGLPANADVYVTVAYREEQTDPTAETGVEGNTRWTEEPQLQALASAPSDPSRDILLARVSRSGAEVTGVDSSERRAAGVVAGDLEVRSLALTDPSVVSTQWPRVRLGAANRADVEGGLRVRGGLRVDGTIRGDLAPGSVDTDQLANGAVSEQKLATDAVSNRAIQNNAISNPKIANNQITESKLHPSMRGKLVTNGDGHDHSGGDGAPIRHSTIARDDGRNPHDTRAEDVGALSARGGTVEGNVDVAGLFRCDGGPRPNPFGRSAVFASGANNMAMAIREGTWQAGSTQLKGALGVWASGRGSHGIFIHNHGGYALYVDEGIVSFSSGKTGYVLDKFVNRSGQTLHTGDVVKLKGTPIVRFEGDLNKIPIPEVALADRESDTAVIGVVDCEAIPGPDEPDHRTEPEDPTSIPDGGDLFVVTLGTYAHCRVDATEAPIEVGDLLTTSSNPGHAGKATEPQLGSIIGKALEPLAEGTGYIAVFVNMQ